MRIKRTYLLFFLVALFSLHANGQESNAELSSDIVEPQIDEKPSLPSIMEIKEKELLTLFDKLLKEESNDSIRIAVNEAIRSKLDETINIENSFFYPFDSLKHLGKVYSDDYMLRVYTWSCEMEDYSYRFYGFIHDFENNAIYPLRQAGAVYIPDEKTPVMLSNWYGALYYRIINIGSKKEPQYAFLGWSQLNPQVKIKLIELLHFEDSGRVSLGKNIFTGYRGEAYRLTFPYCGNLNIALNYDSKKKQFVFDYLVPVSDERGSQGCYGPSMSYDALKKKGKRWIIEKDVDARNMLNQY